MKAKCAVQAVLRRRHRPWEVQVVNNIGNPLGAPGAPNPTRQANAQWKGDPTIGFDHFVQRLRRCDVHLGAAEHGHLRFQAPVESHDPV